MPKATYGIAGYCVIDAKLIPQDRLLRGSVTCSKECYETRRAAQRARQEERECKYCRKPSTPADREVFAKFRRLEKKWPGLIDNLTQEQFKRLQQEWGQALTTAAIGNKIAPDQVESIETPLANAE